MAKCKLCGKAAPFLQRDLFTGTCRSCREAERQKELQRQKALQEEETRRYQAYLEGVNRAARAEQEERLRLQLAARLERLQQQHVQLMAVLSALANVDSATLETLVEAERQHFRDQLIASVRPVPARPPSPAWKWLATGCFVLCLILLFVAWERDQDNAGKVEAANKVMQSMPFGGKPGGAPGGTKMEPALPAESKYALFFAVLSGVGGMIFWAKAAAVAPEGAPATSQP